MLGDDNALKYMGPKLANKNVTVVYYGINGNPRTYLGGNVPLNFKGVLERVPVAELARRVINIVKDNKHKQITLLQDGSTSSAAQVANTILWAKRNKHRRFQTAIYRYP